MVTTDRTVDVRIVGATAAQLVSLGATVAAVLVFVVWQKRRTLVPLAATRAARKLRAAAQRIEDAGLDLARNREETTA